MGTGLALHVSSRTTVRASTRVSRTPAGPEAEPVWAAGAGSEPGELRAHFLAGEAGCGARDGRAPVPPAKSLKLSIGTHWASIPALPLVPPNWHGPFFALGQLGRGLAPWWPSGWGAGVEASTVSCEIGSVWGREG